MKHEQREVAKYFKEISRYPVLSREEEYKVAKKAKRGDTRAREKLIVSNLRFVVQQAHSFSGYIKHGKVTMLDLIQEGNKGLVKAADKFDPERGTRFISYAVWWIRVGMQKLVTNNLSLVKVGTTAIQRKLFFKLGQLVEILYETDPDRKQQLREELAKQASVTTKDIISMEERIYWKDKSIFDEVHSDGTGNPVSLADILEERHSWQEHMTQNENRDHARAQVKPAMEGLNDRERRVIEQRWLCHDKTTLQEIGEQFGVCRERVRQIEKSALNKIERALRSTSQAHEFEP